MEEEARDLSGEAFTRFMDSLFERIATLVDSPSAADNLGAVHAIQELIDAQLGDNTAKVARFAAFLRQVFEKKADVDTVLAASVALGRVAQVGGPLAADVVDYEVKQALQWLQGDRVEARRFAAVLILKEMAEHAPTVFNVHVPVFIGAIWAGLRDPKLAVRERAVEALRACLGVIEKRETRWRVTWYYRLFEETEKGLARSASVESIHGSLLAIGEMLRNTGEFMMARYKEVAAIVLKYRDHRERLIRRSVTSLLPRIAHFLRDRFVASYLAPCMEHLLSVMRSPADRDAGFAALSEMAGAVGPSLQPYLPAVTAQLKDALAPRRGRVSMEALACLGSLTTAVGQPMAALVKDLLPLCFQGGLSPTLVDTLMQVGRSLPSLLPVVRSQLHGRCIRCPILLHVLLFLLSRHLCQPAGRPPPHGHQPGHLGRQWPPSRLCCCLCRLHCSWQPWASGGQQQQLRSGRRHYSQWHCCCQLQPGRQQHQWDSQRWQGEHWAHCHCCFSECGFQWFHWQPGWPGLKVWQQPVSHIACHCCACFRCCNRNLFWACARRCRCPSCCSCCC